jgi:hypothetical protein
MIALSSCEADTVGHVVFQETPDSVFRDTARRVSRVKTLDGGCVLIDSGFSDSDRTFKVYAPYSEATYAIMKHLHEDRDVIDISGPDGFYSGTIENLKMSQQDPPRIALTILIKEKLSA